MFERFAADARRAATGAQQEARRLHHPRIGPEHLLLALLAEDGDGGRTLRAHGAAPEALRAAVARTASPPAGPPRPRLLRRALPRHLPFTRDARRALELSLRAAAARGHRTITSGHVLSGVLAAAPDGTAARALTAAGVDLTALRAAADALLD
ncbi:Clp protease N-terminal domain-containing protein [Nocardiopsis trehalosi]|uniref:Clp protease N-terminal domain-containing protein n=1 Tax=Nocardiopsis trehalosi TaxID=109329 RepID=UPI00082A3F36|nr:Clp protease N-terminal domain-containing protein [Nocardiopsis trehalosi]